MNGENGTMYQNDLYDKNKTGKFQVDVSAFGMKCQKNMTQWKSGNSKQDKTMDGLLFAFSLLLRSKFHLFFISY